MSSPHSVDVADADAEVEPTALVAPDVAVAVQVPSFSTSDGMITPREMERDDGSHASNVMKGDTSTSGGGTGAELDEGGVAVLVGELLGTGVAGGVVAGTLGVGVGVFDVEWASVALGRVAAPVQAVSAPTVHNAASTSP